MPKLLSLQNVKVAYNAVPAIHEASIDVNEHEIVALVGANGAGKTSMLRAIAGVVKLARGEIWFSGQQVNRLPAYRLLDLGIAHVPEGRRLFGPLTVEENLQLGAFRQKDPTIIKERLGRVYKLFPILERRRKQRSQTLSGGEQQMLAIARGLMSEPKLLLLDEPSLGVMPSVVDQIYELVGELAREGVSVVLADQKVERMLTVANRAYVMQTGKVILHGKGAELLGSDQIRKAFLGM